MKVAVSGGTGFIGQALVARLLERGDAVTVLTRDPDDARVRDGAMAAGWNPARKGDWFANLEGHDAVVHLAGEPAVGKRWTRTVKDRILLSRTVSTGLLVQAMEALATPPRVFVCASGVGYYGDRRDEPLEEDAPPGDDFLALVCRGWEAAARGAEKFGVRTVCARIGIVLGRGGGALAEMVKPFRMFAGGPIGSGEQMVSWIHLRDLVAVLERAIDDETLRGAVNAVAPGAVPNAVLAKGMGRVLGRPSFLRVPEFALRARFGEGAEPLLGGQRAVPAALLARGFEFEFDDVEAALSDCLG